MPRSHKDLLPVRDESTPLRRLLRHGWAALLVWSGCLWWAKRRLVRRGAIVPLMLHRVLDTTAFELTRNPVGMIVRERTFAALITYIADRYETVDLQSAKPGGVTKKLRVALTFDDGWADNRTSALPVTQKYGAPITIFVCPAIVGAPALPSPDVDATLSWADILEMHRAGVGFGSHTYTHQILTSVPAQLAREELRESKIALQEVLKQPCDIFAYPNGGWSPELREMVREAGFKLAVTTERGAWTLDSDLLAVPRSNISEDNIIGSDRQFSPTMFEYTTFWKAWRAMNAKRRRRSSSNHRP